MSHLLLAATGLALLVPALAPTLAYAQTADLQGAQTTDAGTPADPQADLTPDTNPLASDIIVTAVVQLATPCG